MAGGEDGADAQVEDPEPGRRELTNLAAFAPISWAPSIWGGARPGSVTGAPDYAARGHQLGCLWMDPVCFQDSRPKDKLYAEAENTATFRACWDRAVTKGADLIQGRTWNDYGESSQLCPSVNHGTALVELMRLYSDAWRAGELPTVTGDRLLLTHRIHPYAAKAIRGPVMRPTLDSGTTARDTTEVLVLSEKGGTVRIGSTTRDVPPGIAPVVVPLALGTQSATLSRGGQVVRTVTSPHRVIANPAVADLDYRAVLSA